MGEPRTQDSNGMPLSRGDVASTTRATFADLDASPTKAEIVTRRNEPAMLAVRESGHAS